MMGSRRGAACRCWLATLGVLAAWVGGALAAWVGGALAAWVSGALAAWVGGALLAGGLVLRVRDA
jgi:hypothetical protein